MTERKEEFRGGLLELADLARRMGEGDLGPIEEYADLAARALAGGGKLLFCGNGGSAADAQHVAAEYVVRMEMDRPALPALALTTDTSVLTAGSNDRGFDEVFARQVEALGNPGDVLVLHSTSGESDNLLKAVAAARMRGVHTVGLLARGGGRLGPEVDVAIIVPTETVSRAQELHLALSHIVCRHVESRLAGPGQ